MAIVKELQHGECKICFCDDYIKTDEKEIRGILDAIGRLAGTLRKKKEKATA